MVAKLIFDVRLTENKLKRWYQRRETDDKDDWKCNMSVDHRF